MEKNKSNNAIVYFPGLTGVRCIAAFMVFLHHFNPFEDTETHKRLKYFFGEFNVGVTLFFVLSGFLIAYRYYSVDRLNFKQYMINRIARIYPMYFILTVITFSLIFAFNEEPFLESIKIFLLNITFLRGFFQEIKFSGISQGWSLTVEEAFYICAPLAFLLLKRHKIYFIILPLFLLSMGLLIGYVFKGNHAYGFMDSDQFILRYTFFGRASEFFIGIGLALFYMRYKSRFNTTYFTFIGLFFIFLFVLALSILGGGYSGAGHPIGMVINSVLLPLFGFAPLFWGLMKEKNLITNLLSSKLVVLLGKSSYIFYLIHLGFIYNFLNYLMTHNIVILFILLNLISIVLFKYVEEPINTYIRKKYKLYLLKSGASFPVLDNVL